MKLNYSQPRQGHAHGGTVRMAGTALAAGLSFSAMAPAVGGIFTVSAQTQKGQYDPRTNPFEADQTIKDMAAVIMGSAPDTRGRIKALFDMIKTDSPTGLKAFSRTGRPPRTAAKTVQKSGDCGELASVVLSMINAMNEHGAGIEADALVVHFHDTPADDEHMVARVKVGGLPLIIDPQAASIGATKNGSYDVDLTLTAQGAAEMYHREYGDYFRDHGRRSEAIQAYNGALEIYERDPYVHQNLGILYEKAGEIDSAQTHFIRANELAPGRYSRDVKRGNYNQELQQGDKAYRGSRWSDCEAHFRNALELGRNLSHDDSATVESYIDDCAKRQK